MFMLPLSLGPKYLSTLSVPTKSPVPVKPESASQGLPATSHDARLYMTRRFAGHDHAQLG